MIEREAEEEEAKSVACVIDRVIMHTSEQALCFMPVWKVR